MQENEQVEEFMGELYDKFYPQVMEGLGQMQGGEVHDGIETLSRPLHTIKGVTGFLEGFEEASTFTHNVESFLKKIQSDNIALSDTVSNLAIESVNMVFQVIEQLRDTGVGPRSEMDRVIENIIQLSSPKKEGEQDGTGSVEVSIDDEVIVISVSMPRVHLAEQRMPLEEIFTKQGAGVPMLLDLSSVVSFGSAAWESLERYSGKFPIAIVGMRPSVSSTYYYWGYDKAFPAYATRDEFKQAAQKQEPKA